MRWLSGTTSGGSRAIGVVGLALAAATLCLTSAADAARTAAPTLTMGRLRSEAPTSIPRRTPSRVSIGAS